MTNLEGDGRFAAALEVCCRRVSRGEALEGCLSDYPAEYRAELVRLVPLAGRVSQLRRDPAPEFQARLERQLLASVGEARRARQSSFRGRFGRLFVTPALRLAVLAAVALVLLAGGGFGVDRAAASSLPDSPLYQLKVARERIQLALARDPESQVAVRADLIAQRGGELEKAMQARKSGAVVQTLVERLERTTERMVDQALSKEAAANPRPAARALVAIRAMQRRVDRLAGGTPGPDRPVLRQVHAFLMEQERRLVRAAGVD